MRKVPRIKFGGEEELNVFRTLDIQTGAPVEVPLVLNLFSSYFKGVFEQSGSM